MTCYILRKDGNHVGFICGDFGEPCRECGSVADYLCDYPVGEGKTCDRPICVDHAAEVGPEIHYCHGHQAEWLAFKESGGVERELQNVVPYRSKDITYSERSEAFPDQRQTLQLNRIRHLLRGLHKERSAIVKTLNIFDHEAEELLRFITQERPS